MKYWGLVLLSFILLSCKKEVGESESVPDVKEEGKPTASEKVIEQAPFYEREEGRFPSFEIESISWCAQGQRSRGWVPGDVDPLLDCSGRWLSWKPNGDIIKGRMCGTPFIWADSVNIGSYGKMLIFLFSNPVNEDSKLDRYKLLDAHTGDVISFGTSMLRTFNVGLDSKSNSFNPYRTKKATHLLSFHQRLNKSELTSTKVILELFYENGTGSYRSEPVSLRPGGEAVDWDYIAKPIVIDEKVDFDKERKLTLKYEDQRMILLDLDSGAIVNGDNKGLSNENLNLIEDTGSDCFLTPFSFGKSRPRELCLALANITALEISSHKYDTCSPHDALAYFNMLKHTGGSYTISRNYTAQDTYWVIVTRQNKVALVKVPAEQDDNTFHFMMKSMK